MPEPPNREFETTPLTPTTSYVTTEIVLPPYASAAAQLLIDRYSLAPVVDAVVIIVLNRIVRLQNQSVRIPVQNQDDTTSIVAFNFPPEEIPAFLSEDVIEVDRNTQLVTTNIPEPLFRHIEEAAATLNVDLETYLDMAFQYFDIMVASGIHHISLDSPSIDPLTRHDPVRPLRIISSSTPRAGL